MNAFTSKEELAFLPANRISFPQHYADARSSRLSVLATLAARVRAFVERQRVLGELSGLTDRELNDIGLSRTDIPSVLRPGYAGHR